MTVEQITKHYMFFIEGELLKPTLVDSELITKYQNEVEKNVWSLSLLKASEDLYTALCEIKGLYEESNSI